MVVPANLNLASLMEFYWGNVVGENVRFSSFLSPYFLKLLLLLDAFFHSFPAMATNTGPLTT